jgi:hypothetical protein
MRGSMWPLPFSSARARRPAPAAPVLLRANQEAAASLQLPCVAAPRASRTPPCPLTHQRAALQQVPASAATDGWPCALVFFCCFAVHCFVQFWAQLRLILFRFADSSACGSPATLPQFVSVSSVRCSTKCLQAFGFSFVYLTTCTTLAIRV